MPMQLLLDTGKVFSTGDVLEGQLVLREVQNISSLHARVSVSCLRILSEKSREEVRYVCYHRELSWTCNASQFNNASTWQKRFKIELDDGTIGLPPCISRKPNDDGYVEVKWVLKAEVVNEEELLHKPRHYCEIEKALKVCPTVVNTQGSVSFTAVDSSKDRQTHVRLPDWFPLAPGQLEANFKLELHGDNKTNAKLILREMQSSKASFTPSLKFDHTLAKINVPVRDSEGFLLGDLINDIRLTSSEEKIYDGVIEVFHDGIEVVNLYSRTKSCFVMFLVPRMLSGAIYWKMSAVYK